MSFGNNAGDTCGLRALPPRSFDVTEWARNTWCEGEDVKKKTRSFMKHTCGYCIGVVGVAAPGEVVVAMVWVGRRGRGRRCECGGSFAEIFGGRVQ